MERSSSVLLYEYPDTQSMVSIFEPPSRSNSIKSGLQASDDSAEAGKTKATIAMISLSFMAYNDLRSGARSASGAQRARTAAAC